MNELEAQQVAYREVAPGEQVKWIGQPDPRRAWRPALPLVLFAIPWTLFSVFWEIMAIFALGAGSPNEPAAFRIVFPLFGLPFVAIGVGMLSSPYWLMRKARSTVYAITDRRALVITGGATRVVKSYTGDEVAPVERRERADGSGDLIFGGAGLPAAALRFRSSSATPALEGFFGIPVVRQVEQILTQTLIPDPIAAHKAEP